jgi:hypothetical protein
MYEIIRKLLSDSVAASFLSQTMPSGIMKPPQDPEIQQLLSRVAPEDYHPLPYILRSYSVGQGLAQHVDVGPDLRPIKLSLTVVLQEAEEGGRLVVEEEEIEKLESGDGVVFAAGVRHSVTPVIKGTRRILVQWFV